MKKLLIIVLTLALLLSAAACSAQTQTSIFSGSNFLKDANVLSVSEVDETTEYAISYEAKEGTEISFSLSSGKYVTHLYNETVGGETFYRLDTTLTINGVYTIGGVETPIEDEVATTARFLGVDENLKPVYSKRDVKAHTLISDNGYKVEYLEYTLTTEYADSSATATFYKGEASTGAFTLEDGAKTYNKIFDKPYIDNEVMLFALRNIELSSSTSCTFKSLDGLSQSVRTLVAAADSSEPTATIDGKAGLNYTNGGVKVASVETYKLNVTNDGTFAGNPIVLYYAAPAQQKEGQRLIKMSVAMPLNIGTLNYLVTKVTKTK